MQGLGMPPKERLQAVAVDICSNRQSHLQLVEVIVTGREDENLILVSGEEDCA